jgi:hypothetical protein
MESYIKEFRHKLIKVYQYTKGLLLSLHQKAYVQGYYRVIFFEVFTIAVTGLLISIALVPIIGSWTPWLSLSYGLIPWLLIQLLVYAKRELK